jgi:hypothetical protein
MRQHFLTFSSPELKERLVTYNGALHGVSEKTREELNEFINTMIDILKERNEL